MRLINFVALGVLLGLVFLIYELKYETRRLEIRAAELSRSIEEEKDNLAVMRAEWSFVSRPERVEEMAGKLLGLQPVKPEQIIPFQEIAAREGRRTAPKRAASRNVFGSETTGAISRANSGDGAQRDDIGALINSLARRADDDRATR
jgi:cell division protein FtsL